jgi:hypothetical protein
MKNIVEKLIKTCEKLEGTPSCCLSDCGCGQRSGHWSGTKEDMELSLHRSLTNKEVTCLSLSRHYGPTPCLSDKERLVLFAHVGQPREWIEWGELANRLKRPFKEALPEFLSRQAAEVVCRRYPNTNYKVEKAEWVSFFEAELAEALDMCPGLSPQRQYNHLLELMPSAR